MGWKDTFQNRDLFLAWVAGFFDGEGCVLVSEANHPSTRRGVNHTLQVSIGQLNRMPLDLIFEEFGGRINVDRTACAAEWRKTKTTAMRWVICGADAVKFLKSILPFTVQKRDEVELACTWEQSISKYTKARRLISDEEFNNRVHIMHGLRYLRLQKKEECRAV